jgi:hypothetical protein
VNTSFPEGKPGTCPSNNMGMGLHYVNEPKLAYIKTRTSRDPYSPPGIVMPKFGFGTVNDGKTPCIGDYNCPGEEKCCGLGGMYKIRPYGGMQSEGQSVFNNQQIHKVFGFCTEPAKSTEETSE